jgi:hypothetical protein
MAAVAIPIIAFGALYVLSNQKKEQFETRNNYPTVEPVTEKNDVNYYRSSKIKSVLPRPPIPDVTITDMAGRRVHAEDFVSDNMTPFFGKTKAVGPQIKQQDESVLDNMVGTGNLQMRKSAPPPLFKPEDNIQYAYGSPTQTDFYQSRVNPAQKASNVKPFESEYVGPGLNQGFTATGSGGFNSGMESRDRWTDKTVDELRVLTNPKQSFELFGHEGPASSKVKNVGIEGKMEKHLPDKYFINTPDRYLTNVGMEQGPTLRAIQPNPTIHRATTSKDYAGNAGSTIEAQPLHAMIRPDNRRQEVGAEEFTPAQGVPRSNLDQASYTAYSNNRTVLNSEHMGGLQSLVSAVIAPITDFVKYTRKDLAIGCNRLGNPAGAVAPPSSTVQVPTTTKETTTFSPFVMGMRPYEPTTNRARDTVVLDETNRQTTSVAYMGTPGAGSQQTSYEGQVSIASNRVYDGRVPAGNINMFNSTITQSTKERQHTAYMGMPVVSLLPPTAQYNETRQVQTYDTPNRQDPDLLTAFKSNPFTHSLTSVA